LKEWESRFLFLLQMRVENVRHQAEDAEGGKKLVVRYVVAGKSYLF